MNNLKVVVINPPNIKKQIELINIIQQLIQEKYYS